MELGSNTRTTLMSSRYGALYGFNGVPLNHYEDLEYRQRAEGLGKLLYGIVFETATETTASQSETEAATQAADAH